VGSYSADLIALLALGLLVVVMRWVFAPSRPRRGRPVDASEGEIGLLSVVDTALTRSAALQARALLGGFEIRSSMSRRRDGRYDVLVFSGDADRAKSLLS